MGVITNIYLESRGTNFFYELKKKLHISFIAITQILKISRPPILHHIFTYWIEKRLVLEQAELIFEMKLFLIWYSF